MAKSTNDADFISQLRNRGSSPAAPAPEKKSGGYKAEHLKLTTPPATGDNKSLEQVIAEQEAAQNAGGATPSPAPSSPPEFLKKAKSAVAAEDHIEIEIALDKITISPFQPRKHMDKEAFDALCLSIAAEKQINPIVVRPLADGTFELVCGERRWRAKQALNHSTIRAVVRKMSDEEAMIISIADNDAREDLSDFERALCYQNLIDKKVAKNAADVARRVGKNDMFVSRCLSFFKLPKVIFDRLQTDPEALSARAAAEFAQHVEDNAELVVEALDKVLDKKLEVINALNWLKGRIRAKDTPTPPKQSTALYAHGRTIGDVRQDGKKFVITCAPGVAPEEMMAAIVAGFKGLEDGSKV